VDRVLETRVTDDAQFEKTVSAGDRHRISALTRRG
jgi:hypothetical protein